MCVRASLGFLKMEMDSCGIVECSVEKEGRRKYACSEWRFKVVITL